MAPPASPVSRPTPLATAVDLDRHRNAGDATIAARFHPRYEQALARAPRGRQVFHGLPFDLGSEAGGARWVLLDAPVTIDLSGAAEVGPVRAIVVAHLCDTWRDDAGVRPP